MKACVCLISCLSFSGFVVVLLLCTTSLINYYKQEGERS